MPYRTSSRPDSPRNFITPSGHNRAIIFLDAIIRLECCEKKLTYHLLDGSDKAFFYLTEEEASKNLKAVVLAKQEWDEYKLRLGAEAISSLASKSVP